ncbi:MAG: glutamate-cysteine ligase family protein [Firmicutes bacterium]|nr:glutamate-cysteine ligase family protein [Bacillota bacterium]
MSKSNTNNDSIENDSNYKYNRLKKKLLNYFLNDLSTKQLLGLELEHFVVKKNSLEMVDFYEENGIEFILKQLIPFYEESHYSGEYLIGLTRPNVIVTLEPGAQFEVSIGEFGSVKDIDIEYKKFYRELSPILDNLGYQLVTFGYHPTAKAQDISLLPKSRYMHMNERFANLGGMGLQMMRGSSATHVTVDFVDNVDFANKYRLANLLVPIMAHLTSNTPTFEGKPAPPLVRMDIWDNTDKERSGFVSNVLDKEKFCLEDYAEYLLNINPMFYNQNSELIPTDKTTWECYQDRDITDEDCEHILSTVFNFVRVKRYIEMRVADSLPIDRALNYTTLLKGIFYNQNNIKTLLEMLKNCDTKSAQDGLIQIKQYGKNGIVYGKTVQEWTKILYDLAMIGLGDDEDKEYLLMNDNHLYSC